MSKIRTELMSMNKLVVLTVILISMGFRHPMHVTVTEVEFDKESKAIEMSMHVFRDDLETEIRLLKKDKELELLELDVDKRDVVLAEYFQNKIFLKVNSKEHTVSYLGHEVEGEAIWAYMEVTNIKKMNKLEVRNRVLLELYDDQTNLIHFEYEGEVYSKKIDNGEKIASYDLENL